MRQCEKVSVTIWGKEHSLEIIAGDSIHDERFQNPDSELLPEELEQLNWLTNGNVFDDELKKQTLDYCNERYYGIGMPPVTEIFPEIELCQIYITKRAGETNPFLLGGFKDVNWERAHEWEEKYKGPYDLYIAVLGECNYDPEHGISIVFKNKRFDRIGQNADLF